MKDISILAFFGINTDELESYELEDKDSEAISISVTKRIKWRYEKIDDGFKFVFIRNNVTNNVTDNVTNNLSEEENEVMSFIVSKPKIKVKEIAEALNMSERTIQRIIKSLINLGLVKRIGTKGGYWEVLK